MRRHFDRPVVANSSLSITTFSPLPRVSLFLRLPSAGRVNDDRRPQRRKVQLF
jgi:hypothetical protein